MWVHASLVYMCKPENDAMFYHLISLRHYLNLEPGWWPEHPSGLPVFTPHNIGITGACGHAWDLCRC